MENFLTAIKQRDKDAIVCANREYEDTENKIRRDVNNKLNGVVPDAYMSNVMIVIGQGRHYLSTQTQGASLMDYMCATTDQDHRGSVMTRKSSAPSR